MFKIKASLLFGFIPVEPNESWTETLKETKTYQVRA